MNSAAEYTRFRACNECRRRRIKCDGRVSGCRQCLNFAVKCAYDPPARPARKNADTGSDIDRRLRRVERAVKRHLETRLLPANPECGLARPPPPLLPPAPPTAGAKRALYVWKVANKRSPHSDGGLVCDAVGQVKFISESSVFSVFLPGGLQWICEKMGKRHFYDPLSHSGIVTPTLNPLENTLIDVPHGCQSMPAPGAALPARSVVAKYVDDYFYRVNCAYPIFDYARFTAELALFYEPGSRPSPAWQLSFYMVLALGCISTPTKEPAAACIAAQAQALSFFRAGCRLLPMVLFCNRELSSVQALLATVLFLWETPSTSGYLTLIGIAASMGFEIGLHRSTAQLQLSTHELELRRNVFWVTYILDKDVSLRIGRASSIIDSDITVGPPRADIPGCTPRVLLQRVQLAHIQADVIRTLCHRVNTTQSDAVLLATVGRLLAALEAWRLACEAHAEPCCEPIAALHALWLQMSYLSCLGSITRPLSPIFEGTTPLEGSSTPLLAARATVNLISTFDQRGLRLFRSTAVQLIAAQVTVFTHVLDDPLAASATADLRDLRKVADCVRAGVAQGCPGVGAAFLPAETLYDMAVGTVARARARSGIGVEAGGE